MPLFYLEKSKLRNSIKVLKNVNLHALKSLYKAYLCFTVRTEYRRGSGTKPAIDKAILSQMTS